MATTPRRRLIRPDPPPPLPAPPPIDRRIQKLRARLDKERLALARWLKRLKRACTAVQKTQATIARLERKITPPEE